MENTINTAVEAVEAVNKIGNNEVKYFLSGLFLGAVITTGVGYSIKAVSAVRKAKKKPVEVKAEEIIEVEE